jgi:hypothetical protein
MSRTLTAALERLIPGATQDGVLAHVERALTPVHEAGLVRLDAAARERYGRAFAELDGAEADALLAAAELDDSAFFERLLGDAIDGLLGGPAGWALIGYPGPRAVVAAADQEIVEL